MNNFKFKIFRYIYNKLKHTKLMTKNMECPGNGFLGHIATELMVSFNKSVIKDAVKKLNVKKNNKIIEIGSGNGEALEMLVRSTDKKITSIEISDKFRKKLINKFKNKNIEFFSYDAKNMVDIIVDDTFDKLLAINVIYFLKPLNEYAKEFYRILKFNGYGLIACKFEGIQNFNEETAPNKNIKKVIKIFEDAGFQVDSKFVDSKYDHEKYHAIFIRKNKNEK